MSNSYVESSFAVDLLNETEVEWWKKEGNPEDFEVGDSNDWAIEADKDKKYVWFHGDESINVESAATVIQRFLKECRPEGSVGFTWAETCSKPLLDSFGGGGCFITAEKIEWNSAYSWVQAKQTVFAAKS